MKKQIKQSYKSKKLHLASVYRGGEISKNEYKLERKRALDEYIRDTEEYYLSIGKRAPKNPPRRSVLEEIGNSVTHGVGAIFAVVAIILMFMHAKDAREIAGAVVYSVGLFVMFTISCLYHSFPYGSSVKRVFRRFDYSSIYLLIGATYAPILLAYIGGALGLGFIIGQWTIIAAGVSLVGVFGPSRLRFIHIPMYLIIGWSGLVFMPEMLSRDVGFFALIIGGGIVYSLGVIPFAIKARVSHFIWHFFVLAGAVVQWLGIYIYIYLK